MSAVLGYWKIRGLAQPIRFLLEYTGTPYEEKFFFKCPDHSDDCTSEDCWLKAKFNLGLDFPNLPYYIDGDTKVTQSNAIMRHIARKTDLGGTTEEEKVKIDILENYAMDIRGAWGRTVYNPDFENLLEGYTANAAAAIKMLSDFLGSNNWMAGENITSIDFIMYELLYIHTQLIPGCLDEHQNLVDYQARFEALPQIEEYIKSDRYIKSPINGAPAFWGGKP